jgi:hypothetical protein
MFCLFIYLQCLLLHHLPPQVVIVSVFVPIASLGQGTFAIIQSGWEARKVFPETDTLSALSTHSVDVLYTVGWLVGMVMGASASHGSFCPSQH